MACSDYDETAARAHVLQNPSLASIGPNEKMTNATVGPGTIEPLSSIYDYGDISEQEWLAGWNGGDYKVATIPDAEARGIMNDELYGLTRSQCPSCT